MTVPGQSVVNYSFDNTNRLTQVSQGTANVGFTYDNANRRAALTLPNGIVMSYTYDAASQLTAMAYTLGGATLGNLTYGYDNVGRRNSVGGIFARTGLPNAISTTVYNANNQLTTWGTATLTYDLNGNMLSDGTNSYVWNARNQLASMNSNGESFQYDPFGRCVAKTIVGTTTNYLYDGVNPVQELSGTAVTANLLTGRVDEYFQRTDSTGAANFLTDALGSTVALTDSTGTVQTSYTFELFGNTTVTGSSTSAYQYTGRENDGTGLYFYRARYYSPLVQRFIGGVPLGFGGGDVNFYPYAHENPVNLTDPFGLRTGQLGVGGSYSFPGLGLSGQGYFGIAVDGQGNWSWYWGYGGGGSFGSGFSAGVTVGGSNASTICGLGGAFFNVSGTGGPQGASATADYFTNLPGSVSGGGVPVGVGGGAYGSEAITNTHVHTFGRYSSPSGSGGSGCQ